MTFKKKKKNNSVNQTDIIIGNKQSFLFTEAYKSLRTNVLFSLPKEGCKKFIVTSALAGEGKSTVSTHLAAALADMGVSVLVIDCDLRRGKTHRLFGVKRSPGLANVLAGFADINSAVQKTSVDNLFVLPSGVVPPNPAELLASSRMQELVDEFSKSFDYIVLDTSPVNVVSDALPLVNMVDGVVVVVRQNYTDKGALERCMSSLEFAEAKVLGVVFNDIEGKKAAKDRRYGYYKGGYYSYISSSKKENTEQ